MGGNFVTAGGIVVNGVALWDGANWTLLSPATSPTARGRHMIAWDIDHNRAVLFGGISILQLHAQGFNVPIPSQFLSMLPYLMTVIVLVIISRNRTLLKVNTPACLGQPFVPDR